MLNPIHLHTFVEVLRRGSFADAARALGYTPSAVSQQISSLERAMHLQLFTRDPRGITPTPSAEHLLAQAQDALGGLRSLDELVTRLSGGHSGLVRMGSFPTASRRLVPAALARLAEERPELSVSLDEAESSELAALLATRDIDLAICYAYDLVPGRLGERANWQPLLIERVMVAVPDSHELVGSDEVELSALRREHWVSTRSGTPGSTLLERLCADAGFSPQVLLQSNDYAVIHELVAAGVGVALIPALGITPTIGTHHLTLADPRAVRRVFLVRDQADRSASLANLEQVIRHSATAVAKESSWLSAV